LTSSPPRSIPERLASRASARWTDEPFSLIRLVVGGIALFGTILAVVLALASGDARMLELVAVLESVLKRNPDHPAANHFYIHAVEASHNLERAIPSAERLMTLIPGAGHLLFHDHLDLSVPLVGDWVDRRLAPRP